MTMRITDRKKTLLDWVLVGNASRARCFERDPDNNALRELADFVHPQSRLKGVALDDDRGGHAFKGAASTQYESHTDAHVKEHAQFAREIAAFLDAGAGAHRFERLSLIASSAFLGELRSHLSEAARSRVFSSAASDLTSYAGADLEHRVAHALAAPSE
jgi:protein required for attachment to host cells